LNYTWLGCGMVFLVLWREKYKNEEISTTLMVKIDFPRELGSFAYNPMTEPIIGIYTEPKVRPKRIVLADRIIERINRTVSPESK